MAYLDKLEGAYTEKSITEDKYNGMTVDRSSEIEATNTIRDYIEDDENITLIDSAQGKMWYIDKAEKTYTVQNWSKPSGSGSSAGGDFDTSHISEMWSGKYKVGSKSYDAEVFVMPVNDKNETYLSAMIFCFTNGKVNPEYIITKVEISKDKMEELEAVNIVDFKAYAQDEYMDFEKILSNYTEFGDYTMN